MTRLIILGAGGHGAVVAEAAILSQEWESVGFLEDNPSKGTEVVGCPVLGNMSLLTKFLDGDYEIFVGLGDNQQRSEVVSSIEEQGGVLANIVHPSSVVSPSVSIGAGSVVLAGAVINARASLDRGCIVNTCASIDHDCVIGRSVHISPGAHLAGCVTVGSNSWIGIGASVKEGINIGKNAIIGAGAAVVSDVDDGATVVGVPAVSLRTI